MNQKGFVNITIIIGIIVITGIAGYFILSQRTMAPIPTPTPTSTVSTPNLNSSNAESIKSGPSKKGLQLSLSGEPLSIKFTGELTLHMGVRNFIDTPIEFDAALPITNESRLIITDPNGKHRKINLWKDQMYPLSVIPGENDLGSYMDSFISEWFLDREIYLPPGCKSNELNPLYGPCAKLSIIPKGTYQIIWLLGDETSNIVELRVY